MSFAHCSSKHVSEMDAHETLSGSQNSILALISFEIVNSYSRQ